jgi:2,3-bisphosphoglycerate-independent phosphoglycerate mutase
MKRVLFLIDAAGDFPYPELGDRTPLECARLPAASAFAEEGQVGAMRFRRAGPDASRAHLAEAVGVPSRLASRMRWGPLGVLAHGESWQTGRVAYLAHFIHLDAEGHQHPVSPNTLEEQNELLRDLERDLRESMPEAEARLLGISVGRFVITLTASNHWLSASPVAYQYRSFLHRLDPLLRSVLEQIRFFLEFHPLNELRVDLGEYPISAVWCWSGGHRVPDPPVHSFRYALLSPDPFLHGLAELCGVPFRLLPDPYHPTGLSFPVEEVETLLEDHDELMIWVPAPFASEEFQEPQEQVRRMDEMDYRLLAPIRRILENQDRVRLLLTAAGVRHRGRPERGTAPCLLWGAGIQADSVSRWTETAGAEGGLGTPRWSSLLQTFRTST